MYGNKRRCNEFNNILHIEEMGQDMRQTNWDYSFIRKQAIDISTKGTFIDSFVIKGALSPNIFIYQYKSLFLKALVYDGDEISNVIDITDENMRKRCIAMWVKKSYLSTRFDTIQNSIGELQ